MTAPGSIDGIARYARWAIVIVGLLIAASGAYVLAVPVDEAFFESATGIAWQSFQGTDPEVAIFLEREARLLGAVTVGFGLVVAAVGWLLLPAGGRRAVAVLWLAPLTLALIAAVLILGDSVPLAAYYGLIAIVAVLAVGTLTLRGPGPARGS